MDQLQYINKNAEEIFDILDSQRSNIRQYLKQLEQELNLKEGQLILSSSIDTEVSFWKKPNEHHYIQLAGYTTHNELVNHIKSLNS